MWENPASGWLHDAYAQTDAAKLIRAVVCSPVSAYDAKLRVEFDLQSTPVPVDKATALALLVNEIVTNTIKCAYPNGDASRLLVALAASDESGKYRLTISDEGVGFDVSAFHPERARV